MLTWKDIENSSEDWWIEEDKQFNAMMEHAIKLSQRKLSREEALQDLISAGILDENGNYTEPYKALEQLTAS